MVTRGNYTVKLVRPTDFLILENLSDGKRNVASNIAVNIDKSRDNVNNRLPQLEDYGLVKKIGPNERSGLYVITDKGRLALENRELYREDREAFDELFE